MDEKKSCVKCQPEFLCWKKGTGTGWTPSKPKADHGPESFLPAAAFDVCIVYAQALKIRECPSCRKGFSTAFTIPDLWWKGYCRTANGYFGLDTTVDDDGSVTGLNTWARFRVKLTDKYHQAWEPGYEWFKLNIFTRWIEATKQTVLIIFDPQTPKARCLERVPAGEPDPLLAVPDEHNYISPFWVYLRVLEKFVTLQDAAVWSVRDAVRSVEKERDGPAKPKPSPDYRHLHETARHATHVSETLELAVKAARQILTQHEVVKEGFGSVQSDAAWKRAWNHTYQRLLFFEGMIGSLQERSISNRARLLNEIALAFNMVAQFDSGVSVAIGRATQRDSEAMKTVAFLTLLFLPATFVSAVFSTTFFDFDSAAGEWIVSDKFWVYWVVAVPITVVTALMWYYWRRIFPPKRFGDMRFQERKEETRQRPNTWSFLRSTTEFERTAATVA